MERFAADQHMSGEPVASGKIPWGLAPPRPQIDDAIGVRSVQTTPTMRPPNASAITLPAMMLHVTVFSLVYQSALVLIGNVVAGRLKGFLYARQLANRLAGITLIGLSAKLASNIR